VSSFAIAVAIMTIGGLIFFAGLVVANMAVLEMSRRLNSRYQDQRNVHWWQSIGNGAQSVMNAYRQLTWKDRTPELRLRFGYQLILAGLMTMLATSFVGYALRGKT
jgi:hypothetical protein